MKKYQKTDPQGIDYTIQMMQDMQERIIPDLVPVLAADCVFYGRAETVKKNGENVLCVFNGKDYDKLGFDDRYKLVTYIAQDQDRPNTNPDLTNVTMFVHADLSKIYTSTTYRADELIRKAYLLFIGAMVEPQQIRPVEIIDDLHPIHSFKVNFTI